MPRSAWSFAVGVIPLLWSARRFAVADHPFGGENRRRGGETLHGRAMRGSTELVLPLVEHHRKARAFINADLQDEVGSQFAHRGAHTQGGGHGAVRVGKVAITASPMVFTTAPASAATISCSARKWAFTRS